MAGRVLKGAGIAAALAIAAGVAYDGHGSTSHPPGALNPAVTQANIDSTVCVSGWTATIRPPVSYTNALKVKQMRARHLVGPPADYEEDHFIPLELGGNPTDPNNLWPQPWPDARKKDAVETRLHRDLCAKPPRITLDRARKAVRSW